MSLKILGIAASRAVRPLWAALELGVPFEHVPTPYQGGATRTPEFLALNPNGHIPVLVDQRPEGPVVVWESMACALYLARVHGRADGQGLAPSSPREEAEALRWSSGIASPTWPRPRSGGCGCRWACWSSTWRPSSSAARATWPPGDSRWPTCAWPVWPAG